MKRNIFNDIPLNPMPVQDFPKRSWLTKTGGSQQLTETGDPNKSRNARRSGEYWSSDCESVEEIDERQTKRNMRSIQELVSRGVRSNGVSLSCHYCRQKTVCEKVSCSRCSNRFCGSCLFSRNGEDLEIERGVKWVCPQCRLGCGAACDNCCICAPCRKSQGLASAENILHIVREAGFSNVHDYLIHFQTGESREKIAKRKEGRCWTKAGGAIPDPSGGHPGKRARKYEASTAGAIIKVPKQIAGRKEGQSWMNPGGGIMLIDLSTDMEELKKAASQEGFRHGLEQKGNVERKKVLDEILERRAPKTRRILDHILSRLLYSDDAKFFKLEQESSDNSGGIEQLGPNRRQRDIGGVAPSRQQSQQGGHAKKVRLRKQIMGHAHPDQALGEPPAQSGTFLTLRQQTLRKVHNSQNDQPSNGDIQREEPLTFEHQRLHKVDHFHNDRGSKGQFQLKRPVTSLQALRKMGILPQQDKVDQIGRERLQQEAPSTACLEASRLVDQALEERPQLRKRPPLGLRPPLDCGLQDTLLCHSEKTLQAVGSKLGTQIPVANASVELIISIKDVDSASNTHEASSSKSHPPIGSEGFSCHPSLTGFEFFSGKKTAFSAFSM